MIDELSGYDVFARRWTAIGAPQPSNKLHLPRLRTAVRPETDKIETTPSLATLEEVYTYLVHTIQALNLAREAYKAEPDYSSYYRGLQHAATSSSTTATSWMNQASAAERSWCTEERSWVRNGEAKKTLKHCPGLWKYEEAAEIAVEVAVECVRVCVEEYGHLDGGVRLLVLFAKLTYGRCSLEGLLGYGPVLLIRRDSGLERVFSKVTV